MYHILYLSFITSSSFLIFSHMWEKADNYFANKISNWFLQRFAIMLSIVLVMFTWTFISLYIETLSKLYELSFVGISVLLFVGYMMHMYKKHKDLSSSESTEELPTSESTEELPTSEEK